MIQQQNRRDRIQLLHHLQLFFSDHRVRTGLDMSLDRQSSSQGLMWWVSPSYLVSNVLPTWKANSACRLFMLALAKSGKKGTEWAAWDLLLCSLACMCIGEAYDVYTLQRSNMMMPEAYEYTSCNALPSLSSVFKKACTNIQFVALIFGFLLSIGFTRRSVITNYSREKCIQKCVP